MAAPHGRRMRRLSTDDDDESEASDGPRSPISKQASAAPPARPRRGAARSSGAVAEHAPPEESRQSIHLKVKAEPSKLKKATGGRATVFAKTNVSSSNIVSGKRKRPTRYAKAGWSTSDDDSDEDEDADGMDVDEQDVDGQENADDDDDDDDEDVDAEGDEDEEMEEAPPVAPRIRIKNGGPISRPAAKPVISLTGPSGSTATVKANELEDEEEELSELESELEGGDEDAEGEEVDENDHGVDSDSEDATPRSVTPDLSKMTRRQRAKVIEDTEGGLMALSNEAQKKKHLTAEEHAMRRAEMARRRKNLSEKRNEEEKMDTINRLLKKQPPKRTKRAVPDVESGQEDEPADVDRPSPLYVRYVQNARGTQLAVPHEWLDTPVGALFAGTPQPPAAPARPWSGRMVEEVS